MAGFFTPTNGGLSGQVKDAFLTDPRQQMIKNMMEQSGSGTPQYGGPWAAMARALSGGLAGIAENKLQSKYQDRQKDYTDTMTRALSQGVDQPAQTQNYGDGSTINWDARPGDSNTMMNTLAGNPDTTGLAQDIMQKTAEAKLQYAMAANKPLTPFEQAQLQGENITDAMGHMVPKYDLSRVSGVNIGMPSAFGAATTTPGAPAAMPGTPGTGVGTMGAPGAAPLGMGAAAPGMLPPPGTLAGTMANSPKAMESAAEKIGENMADRAVPKGADDNVPKMTNTLAMIQDALELNKTAPGGMIMGPGMQLVGKLTNDAAFDPTQIGQRDAYTKLSSLGEAIKAELLKPTVGGNQISNADVNFVGKANSFDSNMSTSEREQRLLQMQEIQSRRRDIEAMEQEAAQQGRTVGPAEVKAYYASKGIDYDSGKRLQAPAPSNVLMPPVSNTKVPGGPDPSVVQGMGPAVKVGSQQEWAQLPKGTSYIAPDGSQRVKQ